MADPFSVAGSAVGVVSLGLTVCQGIVKYYTAFKGQDEELDQAVEKATRLAGLLEVLQPRLECHRDTHPVTVQKVEECLIPCYGAIKKLEELLSKCNQASQSEGFRDKLKTFGRRTLFPFKKETLQSLRCAVSVCQDDVDTAMSILQIDIHDTTLQSLSTISNSNDALVHNTTLTLQRVEEMHRTMTAMNALIPMFAQLATHPQMQANVGNTAARGILQTMDTGTSISKTPVQAKWGPDLCACRSRTKQQMVQYSIGPVVFLRKCKDTGRHSESCRYYIRSDHEQQYGLRFRIGTASRRWTVQAALNYNQAAGSFSVGPTLDFKATVPHDHPTFETLRSLRYVGLSDTACEDALKSICDMFKNGVGAPTDVDEYGNTLLHVILAENSTY